MSAFVPKPTPKTKVAEESRFERILRIAAAHKTTAHPTQDRRQTPDVIGDR